jgi:hypothetical protein
MLAVIRVAVDALAAAVAIDRGLLNTLFANN